MEIQLDDIALKRLRGLQKDLTLSRKQYIKVTVLVMLHQGHTVLTVASSLGIDDNTVYRHVKSFQKVGLQAYLKNNFVAYQGKLTEEQLAQLDSHLQEYIYATTYQICDWIAKTFGIKYTPTGLRPLLHRLGFCYKKTRIVPCKVDEKAQQRFLKSHYPSCLKKSKTAKHNCIIQMEHILRIILFLEMDG